MTQNEVYQDHIRYYERIIAESKTIMAQSNNRVTKIVHEGRMTAAQTMIDRFKRLLNPVVKPKNIYDEA